LRPRGLCAIVDGESQGRRYTGVPTIYLLNGPNLNLLGQREPQIYGQDTLADVEASARAAAARHGFELIARQTNAEHLMVDWLQEAREKAAGIVINPAAFCYHSVPVLDAMKMCAQPIIEVHISNIHRREAEWRANTILTVAATGMITGLGVNGYVLAVDHIAHLLAAQDNRRGQP
jgi:3-dehydroquinate dehydratase II